ncbi:MAG: DUF177 domain-containing protein [Elusimicrobia bacterium]|nr:DUF177 domain-containing protein [Elusimicrobiota bacterium]
MIYQTEDIINQGGMNFSGNVADLDQLTQDITSPLVKIPAPLFAQFEISIGSKDLLLLGEIRGMFQLICSRCAENFDQKFKQELEETYALDLETVDVGEQIRQAIVLALPSKPLCRQDCRGLCSNCGANQNFQACRCRPPTSAPFAKLEDILKED